MKCPQKVIAMHVFNSRARKDDGQSKTYFITLKSVLPFQTLTLVTLGNWEQLTRGFFFFGKKMLLDFAAWIDLNSNNDLTVSVLGNKNTFCFFKMRCWLTGIPRFCDASQPRQACKVQGISFGARLILRVEFHITITNINNLFPRFPLFFLFFFDLHEDS